MPPAFVAEPFCTRFELLLVARFFVTALSFSEAQLLSTLHSYLLFGYHGKIL